MTITAESSIMETVQKYPKTAAVIYGVRYGMSGMCGMAHFENIGASAAAHGINITALIEALNKVVEA